MPSAPRRQREPSEIRASDAERERVVTFLRDKAAEGRLSPDELDERVGAAYRAMTRGELRALVRDLPDPPFRANLERRSRSRPPGVAVVGLAGLTALRLPGLALLLFCTTVALAVAMVAIVVVVAVALGPIIALFVLFALALRRRAGRYGAPRFR
jgi:hypothetical protein